MKVTGTGRSSTWFKGNIFQADSRKRVFFYAVPEKHFLLISNSLFDSYAVHSMTLQNNSKDSIYITKAKTIVHNYEPLEPEEYVLCRVGCGDDFDEYNGLYSHVKGRAQSYDVLVRTWMKIII